MFQLKHQFFVQDMGYTPDFISHCIKPLIHDIKKQSNQSQSLIINNHTGVINGHHSPSVGIRVVTNAGGINPEGCVNAIKNVMSEEGVELSVAMVTGDDMMKSVS